MTLLPPAYAAPIAYFHYLTQSNCTIDVCLNYQRQTYANRCHIMTANGVESLSIPVEKPDGKTMIKDIRIHNVSDWQTLHYRALESAYLSSPFFEHFEAEIREIYSRKYTFLIDFNLELQNKILKILRYSDLSISLSDTYIETPKIEDLDLRQTFLGKKPIKFLEKITEKPYYQTFAHKYPFAGNLSIFDLLFNLGLEARLYLSGNYQ